MKPVICLRIASILTLIHAILHTIGGVFGKPPAGTATMVTAIMRLHVSTVFGVMRSYADFYRGMGLGVTVALTMDAAILLAAGVAGKVRCRASPAHPGCLFCRLSCAGAEFFHILLLRARSSPNC